MKLLKCLVHVDDAQTYVEKDVEIESMQDTQGTVTYNRQKVIVEYSGKIPNHGPLTFRELKPREEETWLL